MKEEEEVVVDTQGNNFIELIYMLDINVVWHINPRMINNCRKNIWNNVF